MSEPSPTPSTTVATVVRAIEERKGEEVQVLDLRGLSDATDFFVIASGTSAAHVRGIARGVVESLAAIDRSPDHLEGLSAGHWVLVDCVDVIVHLFHPDTRAFYRLEQLWQDAPPLVVNA